MAITRENANPTFKIKVVNELLIVNASAIFSAPSSSILLPYSVNINSAPILISTQVQFHLQI